MEKKGIESEYLKYVQHLTDLCKAESEDRLKEELKERLSGGGPPLLRDEGDRIDVLILVYTGFRKQGDEISMRRLRKLTVDLLMEGLRKHESTAPSETTVNLEQVDFLGHLVAWFEVKKDFILSVDLADKLYGFLAHRLKVPVDRLMNLDGIALETAVRAFDLWLAASSWQEAHKWPNHLQELVEKLYINNIKKLETSPRKVEDIDIRLMFLSYKAVMRANPFWVGQKGLQMINDCLDHLHCYSDKIIKKWLGLCHELKMLFRQKTEWKEKFLDGIGSIKNVRNQEIYYDELSSTMKKSLKTMGIEKQAKEKLGIIQIYGEKRRESIVQKRTIHNSLEECFEGEVYQ